MNSLAAFLPGPLVERLGWALLHFVWEGAVIAVMLAVALRVLRRRSAAARYRAGWIALVAMAVRGAADRLAGDAIAAACRGC